MPQEHRIEAILIEAQESLKLVSERTLAIQASLEKCEAGRFPVFPLVPLYQRPKYLPKDM